MMSYPVMIPDAKIGIPYTYRFKDGRNGEVTLREYSGRYPCGRDDSTLTAQLHDMVARTREHLRAAAPVGSIEFGQNGLCEFSDRGNGYQEWRMVIGFGMPVEPIEG